LQLLVLIPAAALVGLFGVCFASAAPVSSSASNLAAARVAVSRCSTGGMQVIEVVSNTATITAVTVNGIDPACAGGVLNLTVNSGAATTSGSATVPSGGGSLTITLSTPPALAAGAEVDLVVVGP
jgi:hypothetical protein